MNTEEPHVTDYRVYILVLLGLLFLTLVTITVTWVDLSALTVLIAMVIASVKAGIVLTYFMHLKFESSLFRVLVIMVLTIYALVILLTFFDYLLR
jgi:cytochrome c oxidase subunit 4